VNFIKVAAGVLNQTPLDWDGNATNIRKAMEAARADDIQILCLPELCITGYGCEDAFYSPGVTEMSLTVLEELLPSTKDLVVSLGLPISYRGGLFNCACLAVDGKIAGFVGKQNLAGEGLHYEPRWFKAWPNDAYGEIEFGEATCPIGDLMFDVGGIKIGFEICEDAWVLDRPGGELAQHGVDILLNPSASHFAFDKHAVRRRLVLDGSRAFFTSYIYANHLGNEAGRAIYDGDAMIASNGTMMATGPRFSFADFRLTSATVDVDRTRMERSRSSSFPVEVESSFSNTITVDYELSESKESSEPTRKSVWESSDDIKEEEFTRCEALALFDYLRKSRSRGFIVSLSGGADSAACASLVAKSVELGVAELGIDAYRDKLAYISELKKCESAAEITNQLLTCVYQATRNSGEVTRNAAETVAQAVNADYYELDVDELVEGYKSRVSEAIGRELTWEEDDLALQNIQARARGPSVWMFANLNNALLLATSNRSEAAVGYATMDGDTCGGLSPIAGIDKDFLRLWLRWMESTGPMASQPIPELSVVNAQQPTAELRPQAEKQTDEADLMPYDLLDSIERSAIRDKLTPKDCYARLKHDFAQYSDLQLLEWTERFFRLWCRNQWKRERYAPSFHLDDENLDPKTWCRFPILSGGYRRELRELRQSVETDVGS
jgi:NAD+ synthase (glutamine-hydrolysing)